MLDRIKAFATTHQAKTGEYLLHPQGYQIIVSLDIWEMLINDLDVRYNKGFFPIEVVWVNDMPELKVWGVRTTSSRDLLDQEIRFRKEIEVP